MIAWNKIYNEIPETTIFHLSHSLIAGTQNSKVRQLATSPCVDFKYFPSRLGEVSTQVIR